jgi:hypothetical protein
VTDPFGRMLVDCSFELVTVQSVFDDFVVVS